MIDVKDLKIGMKVLFKTEEELTADGIEFGSGDIWGTVVTIEGFGKDPFNESEDVIHIEEACGCWGVPTIKEIVQ